MTDDNLVDDCLCDVVGFSEIKDNAEMLAGIKFDVTPQIMIEPRFHSKPEDLEKLKQIAGYIFYIESECEPPALMLLKIGRTDITTTVGRIEVIPQHMVQSAIDNPVLPPVHGMYAITDEIKEWLKKELGI